MAEGKTIRIQCMIDRLAGAVALLAIVGSLRGATGRRQRRRQRPRPRRQMVFRLPSDRRPRAWKRCRPALHGDCRRSGQEPRAYPGVVGNAAYGHAQYAVEPPRYRGSGQLHRISGAVARTSAVEFRESPDFVTTRICIRQWIYSSIGDGIGVQLHTMPLSQSGFATLPSTPKRLRDRFSNIRRPLHWRHGPRLNPHSSAPCQQYVLEVVRWD